MNNTFFETLGNENLKANYNDFVLQLRRKFTGIISSDRLEDEIREIIDQVFFDSIENPDSFDPAMAEDQIISLADELIEAEREAFRNRKRN